MDIILHQYDPSPYATKARRMLAAKGVAWKSVTVPDVWPKPELMPLTGGYRLVPIMQIGSDIYCDSNVIAKKLDEIAPIPALKPLDNVNNLALTNWADGLFRQMVGVGVALNLMTQEMLDDRNEFIVPKIERSIEEERLPGSLLRVHSSVQKIESLLDDGREFLLGSSPCHADFSVHAMIALTALFPEFSSTVKSAPRCYAWVDRMNQFGDGNREDISSADALDAARNSEPEPVADGSRSLFGLAAGTNVRVTPSRDYRYGVDGKLVFLDFDEIVIARFDEQVGNIHVHFPVSQVDVGILNG